MNLFDLESITVEDIMTPRTQVEALNLDVPVEEIKRQLVTCYHNKLPVYEGEINRIIGILQVRKAVALLNQEEDLTVEHFRELLTPAYFIPQDTGVFTQLQYFQENRERLGIIVDEIRRGAGAGNAGRHHRRNDRRVHHVDARCRPHRFARLG